ncbi:MAG: putative AMP-dependent synthetase and ligase [Acidimicrobiales bacterium]|nr:putative AMP-dependent synthetase and ligase [Acidimicrobiales bacterium]
MRSAPRTSPASFAFADLWEAVSSKVAERTALVCGPQRRTYGQVALRVNRLARHLLAAGVEPGDRVALLLRNDVAYLEAMLAAFTIRAIPVNVNYRYVADELRHLLVDSGSVALLFHRDLCAAAAGVLDGVPPMRTVLALDGVDGSGDPAAPSVALPHEVAYEAALAAQSPDPLDVAGRSGDDRYLMYTGGTTGRPKGVLWRQEDAFFACLGGGDPLRLHGPVDAPAEVLERLVDGFCYLPIAPLMHAAAQWTTLSWLFAGGTTVLLPGSLDPAAAWQAVHDERVNALTVVGDAVGRPLVAAWAAEPERWDASSLMAISNGGAPMSPSLKARIAELFPGRVITDGFGSSESGVQGAQRLQSGTQGAATGLARFVPSEGTEVFDEELRPVAPGSGTVGRVAKSGRLPLGYLGDPAKTAATFVEVGGRRYCFSGDLGTVEADGTIQLLGRGSQCINTGGEKVFPEEVEAALLSHPGVRDVLVVGVPDERWGSAVVAVVAALDPAVPPDLAALREHLRPVLAGYKLPKHLVVVDEVGRTPAGKADYRWAAAVAAAGTAPTANVAEEGAVRATARPPRARGGQVPWA